MQWNCWARTAMVVMAVAFAACEGSLPITTDLGTTLVDTARRAGEVRSDPVGAASARGAELGRFRLTMYYVAIESAKRAREPAPIADEEIVLASGAPDVMSGMPDKVTIYHRQGCEPIAEIDPGFARQLDLQGTGKLRDGRVVNTSGVCRCPNSPCFKEIKSTWAIGAAERRLAPFRSVAVDTRVVPLGSLLYIPELEGKRMPGKAPWGGYLHDGCVVADDRGGGIRGKEIDLFVAKKGYSSALYNRTRLKKVTVFDGKGWCERKDGRIRKVPGAI